jgi:peptidase E
VTRLPPITLLGPQHAQPTVGRALRDLRIRGPVAVVTAGWQERESDPGVIPELGVPAVNLTLHARADEAFARDPEFAAAYKARQSRLKTMQDFYRVRLDHAALAAHAIGVRHVDPALLADEQAISIDLVRRLDEDHLERCRAHHEAFSLRWSTTERERVARQRRELAALIAPTDALIIAGGHVAVLLNRLMMFDVLGLTGDRPIIAWSAGAMVLTERVVLFHDHPPYGPPIAEVLDTALGLARGLVVLPHPRLRLHLDDTERVAMLARRFAPAVCVAMDHGARITLEDGAVAAGANLQRLAPDGAIDRGWPAHTQDDPEPGALGGRSWP